MVLNDKRQVLVIREAGAKTKLARSWKLPGGLADLGANSDSGFQ